MIFHENRPSYQWEMAGLILRLRPMVDSGVSGVEIGVLSVLVSGNLTIPWKFVIQMSERCWLVHFCDLFNDAVST
jgi:hypothetical protein